MTLFDDRERAYEAKFVHDMEVQFRATLLRSRLMAEWVAAEMKLPPEEVQAYVRDIVLALLNRLDETRFLAQLRADLAARGIDMDDRMLRSRLDLFGLEAMERVGGLPAADTIVPPVRHH